jgi:hypothetical protein
MTERLLRKILLSAGVALAWLALGSVTAPVQAGSITYITPSGSSTGGGPVNAQAVFTTSANTLSITLTDLQANPKDVAQLLSDLKFTIGNGGSFTGSSLASGTGQEITVHGNHTFTLGSTVAAGWVYSNADSTSGLLNVLSGPGHAGPAHLIIGPPGGGGTYSNANGSIAGNGPHNPFLNQVATFSITGSGITADTTVTSAIFSFGTTAGIDVTGQSVPEPSSLVLSAIGIGLIGSIGVYRSRSRRRQQ